MNQVRVATKTDAEKMAQPGDVVVSWWVHTGHTFEVTSDIETGNSMIRILTAEGAQSDVYEPIGSGNVAFMAGILSSYGFEV